MFEKSCDPGRSYEPQIVFLLLKSNLASNMAGTCTKIQERTCCRSENDLLIIDETLKFLFPRQDYENPWNQVLGLPGVLFLLSEGHFKKIVLE